MRPGTSPARHRPSRHIVRVCAGENLHGPARMDITKKCFSLSFLLLDSADLAGSHHPRAPSVPVSSLVPRCGWLQFAGRRRRRRAFRNTARHAHPFPRACSPQRGAASRVAPFFLGDTRPAPSPRGPSPPRPRARPLAEEAAARWSAVTTTTARPRSCLLLCPLKGGRDPRRRVRQKGRGGHRVVTKRAPKLGRGDVLVRVRACGVNPVVRMRRR